MSTKQKIIDFTTRAKQNIVDFPMNAKRKTIESPDLIKILIFYVFIPIFLLVQIIFSAMIIKNMNNTSTDVDIINNLNISIIIMTIVFFVPYFLLTVFETTFEVPFYLRGRGFFWKDIEASLNRMWISIKNAFSSAFGWISKISTKTSNCMIIGFFFLVMAGLSAASFYYNAYNIRLINSLEGTPRIWIFFQTILNILIFMIFLFCSVKFFLLQ